MIYISVIITHILHITKHAGPSLWAAILVSLLSSIYPLPAMHLLLVTLFVRKYLIGIKGQLHLHRGKTQCTIEMVLSRSDMLER